MPFLSFSISLCYPYLLMQRSVLRINFARHHYRQLGCIGLLPDSKYYFQIFHTGTYQYIRHFFCSKSVLFSGEPSTGMDNRTSRFFLFPARYFSRPKSLDFYILKYNRAGTAPYWAARPLTPQYVPFGIRQFNTLSVMYCNITHQDIVISIAFSCSLAMERVFANEPAILQIPCRVFAHSHAFDRGIPYHCRFSKRHLTRFHGFQLCERIFRPICSFIS